MQEAAIIQSDLRSTVSEKVSKIEFKVGEFMNLKGCYFCELLWVQTMFVVIVEWIYRLLSNLRVVIVGTKSSRS